MINPTFSHSQSSQPYQSRLFTVTFIKETYDQCMGGMDLVLMFMLLSKPSKPEYFQLGQSHSDDEWTIRAALFDQAVDTKSGPLLSLINEHIFTFFGFQSVEPLIQISKT